MIFLVLDQNDHIYFKKLSGELFIIRLFLNIGSQDPIYIFHKKSFIKLGLKKILIKRFPNLNFNFYEINFNFCNKLPEEYPNENFELRMIKKLLEIITYDTKLLMINSHCLYKESIIDDYNNDFTETIIYRSIGINKNVWSYYFPSILEVKNLISDNSTIVSLLKDLNANYKNVYKTDIIENNNDILVYELTTPNKKLNINVDIEDVLFDNNWNPDISMIKKINKLYDEGNYITVNSRIKNHFKFFHHEIIDKTQNNNSFPNSPEDLLELLKQNSVNYHEIIFSNKHYDHHFTVFNKHLNVNGTLCNFKKINPPSIPETLKSKFLNDDILLTSSKKKSPIKIITFKNLLKNNILTQSSIKKLVEIIEIFNAKNFINLKENKKDAINSIYDSYTNIVCENIKKFNEDINYLQNLEKYSLLYKNNIRFVSYSLESLRLKDIVIIKNKVKFTLPEPKQIFSYYDQNNNIHYYDHLIGLARIYYQLLKYSGNNLVTYEFLNLLTKETINSIKFITSVLFLRKATYNNSYYEIARDIVSEK